MNKISEGGAMRHLIDNDTYFIGVDNTKHLTYDELKVHVDEYKDLLKDGYILERRKVEKFGTHYVVFSGGSGLDFDHAKCYLYSYGSDKVVAIERETDSDAYGKIAKTMYYLIEG